MNTRNQLKKIDDFTTPLYELGNDDGVTVLHLLKKYKGKPEAACSVIFNALKLFDNVEDTIKNLVKGNTLLRESNELLKNNQELKNVNKDLQKTVQNINDISSKLDTTYVAMAKRTVETNSVNIEVIEKTVKETFKGIEDDRNVV